MSWRSMPGSVAGLWREIEKIQSIRVSMEDKRKIWFLAKLLAELSGQNVDFVFRKIKPRSESDLGSIHALYIKCQGHSVEELGEDPFFSEVFLNFKPTDYQLPFLLSKDRQETILWTRQGGKTTSIGVKLFKRRVRRPGSQATITGPGLRQAKLVLEKLSDVLGKMDPVAYKAWVEKVLRTTIRLRNRSRLKAFPFSLEKLRGETSDDVDVEEAAFIKECEELVQGTLTPQMATRWNLGAQIILNSTPWGRGFYYKTLNDPSVSKFWTPFITDWRQAVKAGLITQEFIDLQRQQLDPDRFSREYECKFTEDTGRWLSQELITACVDSSIVEPWRFEDTFDGLEFYMGLDVGQEVDNAALSVVEKVGETRFLRYSHIFPLGTRYDVIASHAKVLADRWQSTVRFFVDATNERALAETLRSQIENVEVEGVALSLQSKQRYASFLKQLMGKKLFRYYFDPEVIADLAIEQFEELLGKSAEAEGNIRYFHAPGTHDDRFWSICLAVAASMEVETEPFLVVIPR
jgi:phage FluMu gp28-like protein